MADEQVIRPTKKAIDPAEKEATQRTPEENEAILQQIQDQRQAIASAVGEEVERPEAGMPIQGPVPPAIQKAMAEAKNRQNEKTATSTNEPTGFVPGQQHFRQRPQTPQPQLRATGSNELEGLLQGLQKTGSVYEAIQLPSKGRFYDGINGPRDGVVHVRTMTGEEEQILATPRFVRRGQAINMIFDKCIQEEINPELLLTPDRTYLLIYLRGISYGTNYDVEVKCTECDTKFASVIDLDQLYVDECPVGYSADNLEGTLPQAGFHFRYRLSRGNDEQAITEYRDRRIKDVNRAGAPDDTLLYRTAQLLESVEGVSDKGELQVLLRKLPIGDVAHLRNTVNDPPFGVDTDVEIVCPSCLSDFTIDLPLEANFFFPRRKEQTKT